MGDKSNSLLSQRVSDLEAVNRADRDTRLAMLNILEDAVAAQKEAEKARAEAEAAGRYKDHFLATLSHELRTPLTPVVMATRTMLRQKDLPENIRESLTMIERNIQTESRMIDELLDLTRITRGKLELHRERIDVVTTLKHALDVAKPDLEAKEQKLVTEIGSASAICVADAMRLEQAFWNVLKNASKFTPQKGEIRVESKLDNDQMVIVVADNGVGIEAGALDSIFDPFTQANESIAREFGGLGLGLALARASIEAHGGSIVAQSEGRGLGATFAIRLPLSESTRPGL